MDHGSPATRTGHEENRDTSKEEDSGDEGTKRIEKKDTLSYAVQAALAAASAVDDDDDDDDDDRYIYQPRNLDRSFSDATNSVASAKPSISENISMKQDATKAKVNPSIQAGRRKLEEFKRKKAAALSRRNSGAPPPAEVNSRADLDSAYISDLEDKITKMKEEVRRANHDLEVMAEERQNLQREKASLVGEIMSLKASSEGKNSAQAIELLREELQAMGDQRRTLEESLSQSRSSCLLVQEENEKLLSEIQNLRMKMSANLPESNRLKSL